MTLGIAFAASIALFQIAGLHLAGVMLTPALVGAIIALSFACLGTGNAVLQLAGLPLSAHLPAAFVTGFGVVSVTLFFLAQGLGVSPLIGIVVFALPSLLFVSLPERRKDGARADLGWTITVGACVLAVSLSAIRSPILMQTDGVLPIWYDFLLHGISINAFAGLQGRPVDPEMAGASLNIYHYAPFVPPAALIDAGNISGLTAGAAHLLPLGLLIGALGLYSLVTQLAGRAAAIAALSLLLLVPDPAEYMLRSGWFDMAWLVFGSPGSGYGMGLCFVAAASLAASLRNSERQDHAMLLGVVVALLAILARVQIFMLMAPPLLGVWLWAAAPRLRRPALTALIFVSCATSSALWFLPELRADWLARAWVSEYLDLAVNSSEHYSTQVAPWIGAGFLARAVQLGLVVALSLGVFLLAAPLVGAIKFSLHGPEAIDLLPVFALGAYILLVLFAPAGSNGDFSEYKHRHFVGLYWLFVGFTAAWTVRVLQKEIVSPLAGAAAIAAVICAGVVSGRPVDAPNVAALPWAGDYFGRATTAGVNEAAAFIEAQGNTGDVLAADVEASQVRHGPLTEVMALVDIQVYLARGELKAMRSPCHAAVVSERLALLERVDEAPELEAAIALLGAAGIRIYLALTALPRWDVEGNGAALLTSEVAVYIVPTYSQGAAVREICP